ncbi:Alpha-tocopherol transfer protein, partial [Caligus rogercresseyi]
PFVFNMAFNLIYPFLNENAKKVLHCHGNDMESLHRFVDPRILPSEYGGSSGPFNNSQITDALCSLGDYFTSLKSWKLPSSKNGGT